MKNSNLTGHTFEDKYGKVYVIIAGNEGGAIAYEDVNSTNAHLLFCCDAFVTDNRLHGTYFVNYTVSKNEFFKVIEEFSEQEKESVESIVFALRERYYKIPTVFLKLVGEAWQTSKNKSNSISF